MFSPASAIDNVWLRCLALASHVNHPLLYELSNADELSCIFWGGEQVLFCFVYWTNRFRFADCLLNGDLYVPTFPSFMWILAWRFIFRAKKYKPNDWSPVCIDHECTITPHGHLNRAPSKRQTKPRKMRKLVRYWFLWIEKYNYTINLG